MHMLCKYYFVRIGFDLFVGPFNCLNFSLELCVCVCVCGWEGGCARVRACVRACVRECVSACVFVSFSLFIFFSPNIVHFCYVYKLFLLKTI